MCDHRNAPCDIGAARGVISDVRRRASTPTRDRVARECATRRRRDDDAEWSGAMTPTTARASARARATRARRDEEAVSESSSAMDAGARADAGARTRARGEGRGAREEVLEEEEYAARLEAIIERDYFPDLRTNRLKAALLEATRRGDARAIAAVHREMNVERMRRVGSRGGVVGTPSIGGSGTTARDAEASWETETPQRANDFEDDDEEEEFVDYEGRGIEGMRGRSTAYEEDRHLSVNGFLAKYTSEDNASFTEIVKQSEAKRALKKRHLEAVTAPPSRRAALIAALASHPQPSSALALVEGAEVAESDPSAAKVVAVVGHDSLYTAPNGVALSLKERQRIVASEPKVTIAANTRFVAPKPRTDGSEGKRAALKRYERVHTPSMTPGVEGSPIMTWGQIISTPLRLEDTEEELAGAGKFSMKGSSARERKLRELTARNASGSATPTPRTRRGAPTPNGLSKAGKSLLRRVTTPARRAATTPRDSDLRKSYSGRTPRTTPASHGGLLRLDD